MIKTFFCNDKDEIYSEINIYVNSILKKIIGMYIDYAEYDNELFNIYPAYQYERENEFGKKTIYELYNLIDESVIRRYIKPKYEHALDVIINYWAQEDEETKKIIFQNTINDNLKRKIELYDNQYISDSDDEFVPLKEIIQDLNKYDELCFWDWDFNPEWVDDSVNRYINNTNNFKYKEDFYYLDEYIDEMAPDLRERYLKVRNLGEIKSENLDIEEGVIKYLYNVLRILEEDVININNYNEVKISNEIFRMSTQYFWGKFNMVLEREKCIGRALKTLGEADFYIYENTNNYRKYISIIENKELGKFEDAYNQLQGYLNQNFMFGVTISINRNKSMDESMKYIIKKLETYQSSSIKIKNIIPQPFGKELKYLIRSTCSVPEDKSKKMNIYNLILNLNDYNRAILAKEARKKLTSNEVVIYIDTS